MSQENEQTSNGEQADVGGDRTQMHLEYHGSSQVLDEGGATHVAIFGNTKRVPAHVEGRVKNPLEFREALSVLYDVVKSDHRYMPKDRTAYLAHQRMRSHSSGANVFDAQREYFDWLSQNDPLAWLVLDPIVTVHPDELLFEVFSKDEGSYARLGIDWEAFDVDGARVFGTTNIDYSKQLFDGIQRMRSYRQTRLFVGQHAVRLETQGEPDVLEKKVNVPNSWLRGFLQVQSSATLPLTSCSIAPIDLYNVLRHLRLHADEKGKGRAIRVELVPGEHPRMVLEPWEEVIKTHGTIYKGRMAQVIRIWGRRRLMMLRRLLPIADSIDIHMLGTGLPSFYVLRCGAITLTMGLTGFTSSNWSQSLNLDSLLPRTTASNVHLEKVLSVLQERWVARADDLSEELGMERADMRRALQLGCQNGQLMYDLAVDAYRYRPVSFDLDLGALEFRNKRERLAHDLLQNKGGKVTIESENRLPGVGIQYVGHVTVDADRREYRCEMTMDDEGRVKRVKCTSSFFRKHQLKEGPSAPLIALRLLIAQQSMERVAERGKGTMTYETRTYVKRHERGEDVYHVSLEQHQLKVRWGLRSWPKLRAQNLTFNSVDAARDAYVVRIQDLERKGYMDATAG